MGSRAGWLGPTLTWCWDPDAHPQLDGPGTPSQVAEVGEQEMAVELGWTSSSEPWVEIGQAQGLVSCRVCSLGPEFSLTGQQLHIFPHHLDMHGWTCLEVQRDYSKVLRRLE